MNEMEETCYNLRFRDYSDAIEILYNRFADNLYSYAIVSWKLTEDESWELVYDTLSQVIKTYKNYTFESEKNFKSFVFIIFCNKLKNHYRSKKNRAKLISFINYNEASFEQAAENSKFKAEQEVQESLVRKFIDDYWSEPQSSTESLNILNRALDMLEDWERILLLQRASNVPYSEISKWVDKPESQLKVYHKRVLKKLKQIFFQL